MSSRSVIGLKIRETRRAQGIRQNDLAGRVGISPSYLNLIERNKRAIGGALLAAIGRELSLSIDSLDGTTERRLRDQLLTLAEDETVGSQDLRSGDIDSFIARHPAWARALARIYGALAAAQAEIEALSDRLTHDPVLAEAMHTMLTEITALRSTAEILSDPAEILPQQRRRFERIVDEQSSRLARTATSLAAHFDRISENRRPRTAIEEAENHLSGSDRTGATETAAQRLLTDLGEGRDLEAALFAALKRPPHLPVEWGRSKRISSLSLAYVIQSEVPEIERALEHCPAPALPFATDLLSRRIADAICMPAETLLHLGSRLSWDLDAMVRAADGDGPLVFRRIAELYQAGAPRAGLISVDASGATLHRGGALDLLPRSRQLDCPVWPLHRARSGAVMRAKVVLPGGDGRQVAARAHPDGMKVDMLVFAADAGFASEKKTPLAVGPGCRICTHSECASRREPSIIDT